MKITAYYVFVLCLIETLFIVNVVGTEHTCDLKQGQKLICASDLEIASLKCPAGHKIADLQVAVYRQQIATDCPKAFDANSSCEYSDVGTLITKELQACIGNPICASIWLNPILNPMHCQGRGFTGSVFYRITYICKPTVTMETAYTPDSPLSMTEEKEVTASSLNIDSIKSAPMGNFIGSLATGCMVDLPAGSDLLITLNYFEKRLPRSPCDQHIHLEHEGEIQTICSKNDTPVYLACAASDRQIFIRYSTKNRNVSVVFEMHLEVPSMYRMKVTCGVPMSDDPLVLPYITEEVAGRAIAVGCVIGTLLIVLIVIVIVLLRKRSRRQQYNIHEYQATITKGESCVETSEPAFIIESDKKVLVEESPVVQYSGIY